MTSDSGLWLPTPEFEYKPKLFNDSKNTNSDKENMSPLEPNQIPVLNIEESDFLERTEKLLEKDNKWEAHVAQQIPLPRSSSPTPDNQTRTKEQLEPETEDDMDMRDFSDRPVNDKRPLEPPCKPMVMHHNLTPPPGCPDYMVMNAATAGIPKPQTTEIKVILPKKKKVPRGWPTYLKRSPPKAAFYDNDIYTVHTDKSEHHYEDPKEKEPATG